MSASFLQSHCHEIPECVCVCCVCTESVLSFKECVSTHIYPVLVGFSSVTLSSHYYYSELAKGGLHGCHCSIY